MVTPQRLYKVILRYYYRAQEVGGRVNGCVDGGLIGVSAGTERRRRLVNNNQGRSLLGYNAWIQHDTLVHISSHPVEGDGSVAGGSLLVVSQGVSMIDR